MNPFDTPTAPDHFDKQEAYAYYIGEDLKELLQCDAVYFSKGWRESKGCRIEYAVACEIDIEIYFSLDKIPEAE